MKNPEQAYEGGKIFGKFQKLLVDLPGKPLFKTIPNFHNIEFRLNIFFITVEKDPFNRVKDIYDEIKFISGRAEEMKKILLLGREGKIPERITHNDTKFNNVLLDENDKGLCVIDLDTIMPGYIHYDFGDAIRTITNTGAEDEKKLGLVSMDIELFKAFAKGFLEQTKNFLNKVEIDNLAFAGKFMAFIIGLRFLTDHIDGDNYFKIHFPNHNLQRARAQFKLLSNMEEQFEQMEAVIQNLI